MAYEVRRTVRLEFEDPDGGDTAVVRLTTMTLAELKELDEGVGVNDLLAKHLVEWDFTLDGEPLPLGIEGVFQLDPPLRDRITNEWMKATRTAHPLVLRSDDGQPSEAPPMTMESL